MFGVFNYQKPLEDICYQYLGDPTGKPIKDEIAFRRLVVKELYGADLTIHDVNDAMKVMVGNKLVGDKGVKELVRVLSLFLPQSEAKSDEVTGAMQEHIE